MSKSIVVKLFQPNSYEKKNPFQTLDIWARYKSSSISLQWIKDQKSSSFTLVNAKQKPCQLQKLPLTAKRNLKALIYNLERCYAHIQFLQISNRGCEKSNSNTNGKLQSKIGKFRCTWCQTLACFLHFDLCYKHIQNLGYIPSNPLH